MVLRRTPGRLGSAQQPSVQPHSIPPSFGGLDRFNSLATMPAQNAVLLYNLLPTSYGLRLRDGFVEWANGFDNEVRSLIPFEGQAQDGSDDKLFAVTGEGIFDATSQGTIAPVRVAEFYVDPDPDPYPEQAGRGVYTHFTSDASEHYLFYADGDAGLWRYDETLDTWALAADITGVAAADIAFVVSHKQRIWLIEKDSSDAWYLPIDAISGTATKFTFGSKFKHGGNLVGLYSWSIDGGDGVDDYLIGVSRAGDVLVYRGGDPSLTDWELVGSWFVGEVPNSRRIVIEFGSSLYLLSTFGLTDIAELLRGQDISNELSSPARQVTEPLRQQLQTKKEFPEWQIVHFPGQAFIQILIPRGEAVNYPYEQYTQDLVTSGWGIYRGIPMNCADSWKGDYFFGTKDGRVYRYGGGLDDIRIDLDESEPYAREFEVVPAFSPIGGSPSTHKIVHFIRTMVLSSANFTINAVPVFDYDLLTKAESPGVAGFVDAALWDQALWDQARWGGSLTPKRKITGGQGMGRMVSVSCVGTAVGEFYILGWEAMYSSGGLL